MTKLASASSNQNLIAITLRVDALDNISVRSCELIAPEFRNRMSFATLPDLFAVFKQSFAAKIQECVRGLSAGVSVLALPDFSFLGQGFAVRGARLLVTTQDGVRLVVLRFKSYVGALSTMMQPKYVQNTSLVDQRDVTATKVFHEIAMPLVNISSLNDAVLDDENNCQHVRHALTAMRGRSHEIGLYVELLRRFVENNDVMNPVNAVDGPAANENHDMIDQRDETDG